MAGREKLRLGGFEAIGPIALLHRKDEPFCAALIEQRRTSGFPSWRGAKARIAGGWAPQAYLRLWAIHKTCRRAR